MGTTRRPNPMVLATGHRSYWGSFLCRDREVAMALAHELRERGEAAMAHDIEMSARAASWTASDYARADRANADIAAMLRTGVLTRGMPANPKPRRVLRPTE